MNGAAGEPLKRGSTAPMKFRFRQLVLVVCSALVIGCASEGAAQLERVEPAPRLAVRPLLLLHASDDLRQRGELESAFERLLVDATDEELTPLATCDVECVTTSALAKLGVAPEGVQVVLLEPGQPAVVLVRGRIPRIVENSGPSVFAVNDGTPVSARERAARTPRAPRIRYEFLAERLSGALGPGSPAFRRGCERERAVFGATMTSCSPSESETPLHWRAEGAPFHLLGHATQHSEAVTALATYARERWLRQAPSGSYWIDADASMNCFGALVRDETVYEPPTVPKRAGYYLHFLGAEELAFEAADPARDRP